MTSTIFFSRSARLLTVVAAMQMMSATPAMAEDTREFHHVQGTITIPDVPKRVIAMDLASLDTLDALKIPVVGVPQMDAERQWPEHLRKYTSDEYTKCGSLFEPDADVVAKLKPDLIIVGGRSSRQLEAMNRIAPTIDLSTSTSAFIPSVVQNVLTAGAIFNVEERSSHVALKLLRDVRQLQEKSLTYGGGLVLFTVGDKVMPIEPASRFGIVYEFTGIRPIVSAGELPERRRRSRGSAETVTAAEAARAKAEAEQAQKLFGDIVSRNPDWLFVIDRNSAFGERDNSAELLKADPIVGKSKVLSSGRIVHLSGVGWYLIGGGVQQLQNTIAQINAAFDAAEK